MSDNRKPRSGNKPTSTTDNATNAEKARQGIYSLSSILTNVN